MLNFPSSPTNGQVFGNYTYDGEKWMQTAGGVVWVAKAGDTMTGDLTINKATPRINLDRTAAGQQSLLSGRVNSVTRWNLQPGDNSAESSGNAGSNFLISRFDDSGNSLGQAFNINRATGVALFSNDITNSLGSHRPPSGANGGWGMKAGDTNVANSAYCNFDYATSNVYMSVNNTYVGQLSFVSDYRIKQNTVPLPSMWATVKTLRPIRYNHRDFHPSWEDSALSKADGMERWGFVAHELQEDLILSAATGVKDQSNCLQAPNPFTIIAALTKALQEAMVRIEALEAKTPSRT